MVVSTLRLNEDNHTRASPIDGKVVLTSNAGVIQDTSQESSPHVGAIPELQKQSQLEHPSCGTPSQGISVAEKTAPKNAQQPPQQPGSLSLIAAPQQQPRRDSRTSTAPPLQQQQRRPSTNASADVRHSIALTGPGRSCLSPPPASKRRPSLSTSASPAGSRRQSTVSTQDTKKVARVSVNITDCFSERGSSSRFSTAGNLPAVRGSVIDLPHEDLGEDVEDEEVIEIVELLSCWKTRRKSRLNRASAAQINKGSSGNSGGPGLRRSRTVEFDRNDAPFLCRTLPRMVQDPGASRRLCWDLFGILLIAYDVVYIPLQTLDPPIGVFSSMMSWIATAFWTLDIPFSFFVGYHHEGIVEMRITKIAKQYAKTWLPFDLLVVGIDWSLSLAALFNESQMASSSSYLRVGKLIKFLRLLRLLRLLKAHGVMKDLLERIQSEWALIMLSIARLLIFILLLNHVIGCMWYGVGTMDGFDADDSWVARNLVATDDIFYRYATSLHWSLTQFTPASMEVTPTNVKERLFAVTVIVFAMVVFSSFVSTITNAMTQLRNIDSERNEQLATLRKYLTANKISSSLVHRIGVCLKKAAKGAKRRIHEEDVVMMHLLPWNLKTDLQEEVYLPILSVHPLFVILANNSRLQLKKLLQHGLEEISLGTGQEFCNSGDVAEYMYFIVNGVLSYKEEHVLEQRSMVSGGQWVAEPVLWIVWKHSGQLIGTNQCELIAIKATKFQEVFTQSGCDSSDQVKKYARLFVRYFKSFPESLSDIWADMDLLQEMSAMAFLEEEDQPFNQDTLSAMPTAPSYGWGQKGSTSAPAPRRSMVGAARLGVVGSLMDATQAGKRASLFGGLGKSSGLGGADMEAWRDKINALRDIGEGNEDEEECSSSSSDSGSDSDSGSSERNASRRSSKMSNMSKVSSVSRGSAMSRSSAASMASRRQVAKRKS